LPQPAILRIVYMGDSITYGQYVDEALRWTALIDRRLVDQFPDIEFQTFNRGVSGETTTMGLLRFPSDVQELAPDVLTLHFGLNDCNCWESDRGLPRTSERVYEANLLEMIVRGQHFGAREVVVMTSHRTLRRAPMISGEVYEDASERYSRIMRSVAKQTGVALADIRGSWNEYDDGALARYLLPPPDILHLSIEGNAAYAELMWPSINRAVTNRLKGADA
jgi:lysophospholipase L1-like esterase